LNNVEVGLLSAFAASSITFIGQQTVNRASKKLSLRSEKYSAYEDFLSTANGILRNVESILKHELETKRIGKVKDKIEEELKSNSVGMDHQKAYKELDDLAEKLDELIVGNVDSKKKHDQHVLEMDRALSKLQLSASSEVLDLGQKLYFQIPSAFEESTPKNFNKDQFHEFVSAARDDLSHPNRLFSRRMRNLPISELWRNHNNPNQIKPNL